jgi:FAD/FMN-containing dehydrogenase
MPDPESAPPRGLAARVSAVAFPGDTDYARLATPWNLAVPTTPLAVVEAASAEDVVRTVTFAAERGIPVAVQSTGHGASADLSDAILVRTTRLTECTVHADERWARVGAGVVWAQVLEAIAPDGLAALAGSSPGVGVVGYTTGGGHGPLARTHGLAADRVRAFDVVTGDGRLLRSTATEHPDLFWGLRGGKGALGIVTAIEFDLLPIPQLYAGALYFGGADAAAVVGTWSRWCEGLPSEATTSIALLQLPEMPGVPEPLAGRLTVAVRFAWTGDPERGAQELGRMRAAAPLLIDGVGMMPYAALGRIHSDPVDPLPSHEGHALLSGFPGEAAERLVSVAGPGSGSPQVAVEVRQLGGAVASDRGMPAAFDRRDAAFSLFTVGIAAPPIGEAVAAHAAAIREAMAPWTAPGALPNFAPGVDTERFRRVYTPEVLERLRSVSATYDPSRVLVAGRGLVS